MNSNYPFTIIAEKESTKDEYISQSHDRIANTILENITKSEESFSIGLEGNYGVGKSTIIKIISNRLKDPNEEVNLFKFDAWAHEGDPLRKIFLTSFIEFLNKNKKTQKKLIEKHIIGNPRVEKHITRSPTALGIFFTLATLLVPVGLALSRKIYIYYVILDVLNGVSWFDTLIILLLLGPVIVAVGNIFLLMVLNKNICDLKNWTFINSSGTEHIIEKARGKVDKTSLEFEKSFLKLLKYYFSNPKRKLIIVIDNLDRVQNHDGLKLFNIIQSIFDSVKNKRSKYLEYTNKTFSIIPYDYYYFNKLKSHTDSKLIDYLDKTIKIRLSVPSPVYSDWKEISEVKIRNAFDKWPNEELNDINRIYQRSITKPDHSFSPRQLILFINQVGILRNHFRSNEIKSEIISYYVIHRYLLDKDRKSLISDLIDNKFPSTNDRSFLNSTDIKGQLASILYDTTIDDAYVILLADELSTALYDNDEIILGDLYEGHKNHFDRVFYDRIKEANTDYLIQSSPTIINVLQHKADVDLTAFKKELNIYFNSNNEFRGFWDEKTEKGFITSVNFACTEPIDDFWDRMIKKDFLDKMPRTEKDGYIEQQSQTFSKISRIYHNIDSGLITKKISLNKYVNDYSALSRLDYKADLRLFDIFDFSEKIVSDFEIGFNSSRNDDIKINPNIYYLAGFIERNDLSKYLRITDDRILQLMRGDLVNKEIDTKGIMYFLCIREVNNKPLSGSHDFVKQMNRDTSNVEAMEFLTIMMLSQPKYFSKGTFSSGSNWIGYYWSRVESKAFVIKVYQIIHKYHLYQKFWHFVINYDFLLSNEIIAILFDKGNLRLDTIIKFDLAKFQAIGSKLEKHDKLSEEQFKLEVKLQKKNKLINIVDKKLLEVLSEI